jgi:hypothetical protein
VQQNTGLSIKDRWKEECNTPKKCLRLVSGSIIIFAIMALLPYFFRGIEKRQGVVLHDWVLEQLPAHNVSVIIFILIWGMGMIILYRAIYKPRIYVMYAWSLIFVCIARMVTISLVALNPPIGLIPLADPLTGVFYGHAIITKDLFFSGHISTLMLMFLCLEKKTDKMIGIAATILLAFLLLVQHIHYTIDVLAAPIVTYTMYRLTRYLLF